MMPVKEVAVCLLYFTNIKVIMSFDFMVFINAGKRDKQIDTSGGNTPEKLGKSHVRSFFCYLFVDLRS